MKTRQTRKEDLLEIAKAAEELEHLPLSQAETARRLKTTPRTLQKAKAAAAAAASDNPLVAELSPEAVRVLKNVGINTLDDLIAADLRRVTRAPGFGRVTLGEIKSLLERRNGATS